MAEERFNGFVLLLTHAEIHINVENIIEKFIIKGNYRLKCII